MSYCAAGILPLAKHQDQIWVLLGNEPTNQGMRWLAFGGKREAADLDSKATALREYREESGCLLPDPELLEKTMYDFRAKYVLYVGWIPYVDPLPTFSNEQAKEDPTLNKRELCWFLLDDLINGSRFELGAEFPIKPWFQSFLQRERYTIRKLALT